MLNDGKFMKNPVGMREIKLTVKSRRVASPGRTIQIARQKDYMGSLQIL